MWKYPISSNIQIWGFSFRKQLFRGVLRDHFQRRTSKILFQENICDGVQYLKYCKLITAALKSCILFVDNFLEIVWKFSKEFSFKNSHEDMFLPFSNEYFPSFQTPVEGHNLLAKNKLFLKWFLRYGSFPWKYVKLWHLCVTPINSNVKSSCSRILFNRCS